MVGDEPDRPIMAAVVRIALDAMGGDHGVGVVAPAALLALAHDPALEIVLVGCRSAIEPLLARQPRLADRVDIRPASQVVAMDDPPALALRNKKDSSMRVAIDLVKSGAVQACVSAGNTGALMATAKFVLKTLPGIERPAICAAIPSSSGHTHMLDLGANVSCSAEQLCQFALMGSELSRAIDGNAMPRITLLNIGEEDIKGHETVRQAAALLRAGQLNYVGYSEGDDVFHGDTDVVVCDGFAGNVALKTCEGVARMIRDTLQRECRRGPLSMLAGLAAYPILRRLRKRIDPRRYNGAVLLGLPGIVIKSHGGADQMAFANAIHIAAKAVREDVIRHIAEGLVAKRTGEVA